MGSVVLNREPIDVKSLAASLTYEGGGAAATFVGIVRSETKDGRSLSALDYHAYEDMAMEQMTAIVRQSRERFDILDAAMAHRLGELSIGQASIAVVVSSAHRGPAFDACRWIVDAVKADVPIWKQDVWADGTRTWVEPNQ
ncbi:MAG: molybdenum cofactor biosynthesis protein MoaE [Planctomycetes bacterium]|nr:molybdenum cofactor biosynthesis protein MoaE [Planctomycetota bacterium]